MPNDPLKARIYTLDNGLKVYITVNKETPRIQTYIAVRVGGKNDPAETTGLAHYFEHLMFKGTDKYRHTGLCRKTRYWAKLNSNLRYTARRRTSLERKAIYAKIDSISYEASKYAIPNEYDKLMAAIGANGTNAYTSFDELAIQKISPATRLTTGQNPGRTF